MTDVPEEVKYKYALLDVFGDDCFPVFINILQVSKTYIHLLITSML